MKSYTRDEIRKRFRARLEAGEPLVLGGAGIGLIAKAADRAGIDGIMAYNTGPFRMDGHGSLSGYLAYGDANALTLELAAKILPVVSDTPVFAGIGAADPYRSRSEMITEVLRRGYSGVTNVPTAGIYDGGFRQHIDDTGLGYPAELELIAECHARDVFTIAYAFTPEEAAAMTEAGADVIGAHVGLTVGGMIGAKSALEIDDAVDRVATMCDAARAKRSDVWVVAHGGAFDVPENVQLAYDRTDVDGFLGASSIERLPVEQAVADTIVSFRSLRFRQ